VLDAPYGHAEDVPIWRAWPPASEADRMPCIARGGVARLRARGIPDPTRPDLTEARVVRLNREYRYTARACCSIPINYRWKSAWRGSRATYIEIPRPGGAARAVS